MMEAYFELINAKKVLEKEIKALREEYNEWVFEEGGDEKCRRIDRITDQLRMNLARIEGNMSDIREHITRDILHAWRDEYVQRFGS